jgi:hypothetical protein
VTLSEWSKAVNSSLMEVAEMFEQITKRLDNLELRLSELETVALTDYRKAR